MYEPSLDRIVCPLTAGFAGEAPGGLVAAGADLRAVYPQDDGLATRLGAARASPARACSRSPTVGLALHAARVRGRHASHGIESAREGAALAARLAQAAAPSLTLLYLDDFDAIGHELGPGDPRAEAVALALLEAIEHELVDALAGTPGALVLVFADHGQVPTDPARCVYVNERCPQLVPLLRRGRGRPPAGAGRARRATSSCTCARVRSTRPSACSASSSATTPGWCRRRSSPPTASSAPTSSERFRERVGDLVVLPRAGVEAWWHEPGRFEQDMLGHHGGLEPDEAETWIGALVP